MIPLIVSQVIVKFSTKIMITPQLLQKRLQEAAMHALVHTLHCGDSNTEL